MHSHNKLIIGVPVYNEIPYIKVTLESLASQSHRDFIVLIADNHSDDGSSEVCRDFVKIDPRFVYHRHDTNVGASANFRYLFENTNSTYFMWLGAHDTLHQNYIKIQLEILDSNPDIALAYSRTTWIDEFGNMIRESSGGEFVHNYDNPLKRYLRTARGPWGECTAMNGIFRRSALRGVKFFSFAGPDHFILTRAQFFGRFYRTESPIYFRREFTSARISYLERISGISSQDSTDYPICMAPLAFEQIKDYLALDIRPLEKIGNFPKLLLSFEVAYQLYTTPIKRALRRGLFLLAPPSVRRVIIDQLRSFFGKH